MPAPNTPNTAAAAQARREAGDRTAADRLIRAGWTVTPPNTNQASSGEQAEALRRHMNTIADHLERAAADVRQAAAELGTRWGSHVMAATVVQSEVLRVVSACRLEGLTVLAAEADAARGGVEAG